MAASNAAGCLFAQLIAILNMVVFPAPFFEEAAIRAELEIPVSPAPYAAVGGPLEAILLALLLAVFAWALFTRDPEFP